MTGADRLFLFGHGQFSHFAREGVDAYQHPVESGHDEPALVGHLQIGHEGRFGIVPDGDGRRFPGGLVVSDQAVAHAAQPDAALSVLCDGIGIRHEKVVQDLEAAPFVAAPDYPVLPLEEQPQVAAGVAEDLRATVVAHAVVRNQGIFVHVPEILLPQVIQPQAVAEGGNPETLFLVQAQGCDGLPGEGRRQELIAIELVLVQVGDGVSLVRSSEPQVVLAVSEDGADLGAGQFEGETGVVLEKDAIRRPIIVEHALADDVQQDGPVIDVVDDVHVALHQPGFVPDGVWQRGSGCRRCSSDPCRTSRVPRFRRRTGDRRYGR